MGAKNSIIKYLVKIFGEKNVLVDKESLESYSCDASALKVMPSAVVFPEKEKQIHDLIIFANRSKLKITPRGAATGLCGGATPSRDSVVVDLSRMNRILKIDTKNMFAEVEAGVVLDDLNSVLKEYNLMFPVIPSSHSVCQIGGMISTNAAGKRAIKYGKTSAWVIELNVIDGTGKHLVLKNPSDFFGSEGTLGIITKAKLLLTEPKQEFSLSVEKFKTASELVDRIKEIREKENLLEIEFMDRICSNMVGFGDNYTLFIEYSDVESGQTDDPEKISEIESLRDSLAPLLDSAGFSIIEDPKLPIHSISKFLVWLYKHKIPSFGHIGIGIIHPRFKEDQKKLIQEMFKLVKKLDGEVSGEHGIGIAKKEFASAEIKALIRGLKHKYDPHKILNPGKIIS